MEHGNSISVSRLLALPSHKRGGGSGRELAGGLGRPLLVMPGHLPPSWLPHHVLPRRRNSSSHRQLERQGLWEQHPWAKLQNAASRSWCKCRVCCVSHVSQQTLSQPCSWWWHRTAVTVKGLEGSQKTAAGPTRGGWASPTLGELITEPRGTGRSRQRVCTSRGSGRLRRLLSCHRGGDTGFPEDHFLLIKWGALNITHTYEV